MRYKNFLITGITAAVTVSLFLFTACRKNKDAGEDTGYAQDHATLEKTFDDAQNISDQAYVVGNGGTLNYRLGATVLGGCAHVTHDSISVPHTITVDFGTVNCTCQDNKNRRGKIIITYTGHYKDQGSQHTISFDNYFVNDNQVTGTKSVTNMGPNSNNEVYYNISVNGAIILANNAGTISWTSTRVRTWKTGYSTNGDWLDDSYEITGSGSVTRANGKTFTMNITSPLLVALNCPWIEQGTVEVTPQGAAVRTLDYGNGSCDAQATLTVNGNTYNVNLH